MSNVVYLSTRKRRPRSLLELDYERKHKDMTEQLQSELAVNLSDAIKARRERIRQVFQASGGLL